MHDRKEEYEEEFQARRVTVDRIAIEFTSHHIQEIFLYE